MSRNQSWEVEISALLDDELDRTELLAVVDELVASPEARASYRELRSLDRLLGADERSSRLPPELWQRIVAAAERDRVVALARPQRSLRPVLAVAAALLLATTGWLLVARLAPLRTATEVVTVQVGADRGQMSDERFIALTTELLGAEPRYHRTMQQIMTAVTARSLPVEGSGEGLGPLSDDANVLLVGDRATRTWD
jgi:anti-sigma factor RsiW